MSFCPHVRTGPCVCALAPVCVRACVRRQWLCVCALYRGAAQRGLGGPGCFGVCRGVRASYAGRAFVAMPCHAPKSAVYARNVGAAQHAGWAATRPRWSPPAAGLSALLIRGFGVAWRLVCGCAHGVCSYRRRRTADGGERYTYVGMLSVYEYFTSQKRCAAAAGSAEHGAAESSCTLRVRHIRPVKGVVVRFRRAPCLFNHRLPPAPPPRAYTQATATQQGRNSNNREDTVGRP